MKNSVNLEGLVRIEHRRNGRLIKDTGFIKNGTPNVAFAVFTGLIGNTGAQTAFSYIAVGTSSTAFTASQTTLVAELAASGLTRASGTASRITTTQTNDTFQLVKTFSVTGTQTVTEAGIFNDPTVGVMGGRTVFTGIPVVSADTLTITYQIKFS